MFHFSINIHINHTYFFKSVYDYSLVRYIYIKFQTDYINELFIEKSALYI